MDNVYENMPSSPIGQRMAEKNNMDIKKIIDEALEPRIWKDHVVKDLMKFWDTPEATEFHGGLFNTNRNN